MTASCCSQPLETKNISSAQRTHLQGEGRYDPWCTPRAAPGGVTTRWNRITIPPRCASATARPFVPDRVYLVLPCTRPCVALDCLLQAQFSALAPGVALPPPSLGSYHLRPVGVPPASQPLPDTTRDAPRGPSNCGFSVHSAWVRPIYRRPNADRLGPRAARGLRL